MPQPSTSTPEASRDDLQRQAIRLYNELSRIRKAAKAAARCDRGPLEAQAKALGSELLHLLEQARA